MTTTLETLRNVTTGTITTMLLKKGIRRSWMAGAMPFGFSGKRVVGPAFTLRFVPVREDLATPESWSKPISTRSAIEAMPENCVVVADAMGVTGAGIFGDILCMRMVKRGVSALISDGVMRDKHGVVATGLPVWCAGMAAPASRHQVPRSSDDAPSAVRSVPVNTIRSPSSRPSSRSSCPRLVTQLWCHRPDGAS